MKVAAILLMFLWAAVAKVSYDGYQVYCIDTPDFAAIEAALASIPHVLLECAHNHRTLEIAVAPGSVDAFRALGLDATLTCDDLGADLAVEGELRPRLMSRSATDGGLPDEEYFASYHALEDHIAFLDDLQKAFPNNSETFVAGQSFEGRDIKGLHLWGRGGPGSKPAIIWHGTVHAREWIVAPTVEYMTYHFIKAHQGGDELITRTLDDYDIYVMPVVNPDGFVYTTTEDRMWRKNREPRHFTKCIGSDLNRNWPHQWNVSRGASTKPCSETYRGVSPGDTIEMAVLTNHTMALAQSQGIKLYIDWHSFSQMILLPYAYSCFAAAANRDKQMSFAKGVSEAIRDVNGLGFVYGPACDTIYQSSGSSMDWAYDIAGAEVSWSVELRPKNFTGGGFALSPRDIMNSGEENWAGMRKLFSMF